MNAKTVFILVLLTLGVYFAFKYQDENRDRSGKIVLIQKDSVGIDIDNNNIADFKTRVDEQRFIPLVLANKELDLPIVYDKNHKIIEYKFPMPEPRHETYSEIRSIQNIYFWKR